MNASGKSPLTISKLVPSPPTAMNLRKPLGISPARMHGSFSGSARFAHFESKACRAEPLERARGQLSAASAAGCRIHDREISLIHKETIAPRSSCLPICPARMTRLIFIAALRGKS